MIRSSSRAISITLAIALFCNVLANPATTFAAAPDGDDEAMVFTLSAELGAGRLDEDIFFQTRVLFAARGMLPGLLCERGEEACEVPFRAIVQAPVRLRVVDEPPLEESLAREEDWDETADLMRVIRLIEYGREGQPLALRLGVLGPVKLGHGSILDGYFNVLNPDHYKLGVELSIEQTGVGFESLLDSVIAPRVVGGALALRPMRWLGFEETSALGRIELTTQVVADLAAPLDLVRDADAVLVVDDTRRPEVARAQRTEVFGVGLGFWALYLPAMSLRAGAESNFHPDVDGFGQHLTLDLSSSLGAVGFLSLSTDLNWSFGGYVPRYFGPLYDVERYQVKGWGAPVAAPKLRVAASLEQESVVHLMNSATLFVEPIRSALAIQYATSTDLPGADFFGASFSARPVDMIDARLYYWRPNIADGERLLSLDRAVLASELRVLPFEWLYLVGRYDRRWRVEEGGGYAPIQDWYGGVGFQTAFGID